MRARKVFETVAASTLAVALLVVTTGATAPGDFTYKVRQDKLLGGRDGQLTFAADCVEYRSADGKHGGSWAYRDIRQIELLSPTRVRIVTFEDDGRRLGADRSYTLDLVDGRVTHEVSDFLRSKVSRPLVTSFTDQSGESLAELAVKHNHRFGGCQGTITVFDDRLVYASEKPENSRTWLWHDVRSVTRPDPYRLEIATYERELGARRTFTFDLKTELSDESFDRIWQRVYRPTPLTVVTEGTPAPDHSHLGHNH